MTRRLLNLLTALSLLLLCVAVCALWARSYAHNETVGWYTNEWRGTNLRTTAYGLSSDSGGLLVFGLHRRAQFKAEDAAFAECRLINPELNRPIYVRQNPSGYPYMAPEYSGWGSLGFGFYSGQRSPPQPAAPSYAAPPLSSDDRLLVVPHWLLAAVASLGTFNSVCRLRRSSAACPQ
jgi:hypothetical protein